MLWIPAPKSCPCNSRSSLVSSTSRIQNPRQRLAQVAQPKPESVTQYKEAHRRHWSDVQKHMKACNIENYSVFHDAETNLVFVSFIYVGHDFFSDMERLAENERVQEWRDMTAQWQEGGAGHKGGESISLSEDVELEKVTDTSQYRDAKCTVPGFGGAWKTVEEIAFMSENLK
ncbi:uncharacterized protein BROUX77_004565 [Berkeleyomyces rouxiae]|uniref:uncharacterized protein n=1 Tax=Berkeleyomyces rouxiae TaxID=2035830 RepID=UPI003B7FB521